MSKNHHISSKYFTFFDNEFFNEFFLNSEFETRFEV